LNDDDQELNMRDTGFGEGRSGMTKKLKQLEGHVMFEDQDEEEERRHHEEKKKALE